MKKSCNTCVARHRDEKGAFCEFLDIRLPDNMKNPPCISVK